MATTNRTRLIALGCLALLSAARAFGWGADGHHTVGAIADQLIAGTHAAAKVHAILGDLTLQDAAVWADCAKGVDPKKDFAYTAAGAFAACAIFETPAGEAEMSDFVRRNTTNCVIKPGEEICHKQYHYADVAIERSGYAPGTVGTRDDDIVQAVVAATHVLKGDATPAPINLKSPREALLVLAHYAGDIHQPLHVGAVYLDATGAIVDPDSGTFDPSTATRGGNQIIVTSAAGKKHGNLHATWDAVPASLRVPHVDAAWLAKARAVPATSGDVLSWPAQWGTGTVLAAHKALDALPYGAQAGHNWPVVLPAGYSSRMTGIKRQQLTLAGARLAQLLEAIWP